MVIIQQELVPEMKLRIMYVNWGVKRVIIQMGILILRVERIKIIHYQLETVSVKLY